MRLHQFLKDYFNLCKSEVKDFNHNHITVNGVNDKWLSYILKPNDVIAYDGKEVKVIKQENVYLLLNKPVGIVCTNDRKIENNLRDYVNYKDRIFPIGRLDKDSCGIIILTNDGKIFNKILDSNNHVEKEYLLRVDHPINSTFIDLMQRGVPILGKVTKPCIVKYVSPTEFKIILQEGMNRQIRRMCHFFGYRVLHLERIRIGNLYTNDLKRGEYRFISNDEIASLISLCENGKK